MRNCIAATFMLLGLALGAPNLFAAQTYSIDASHSWIGFTVKHLGVGHAHGRFNSFKGTYNYDQKNPAKSTLKVEIDAASVDSGNAKRDGHLKSPDFFNTKLFPKIIVVSTSIKGTKEKAKFTGKMTLLGKTKTITGTLTKIGEGKDPWGNYRSGFDASFSFKRSDFGMNYMTDGISDLVTVSVSIEGIRK